MNVLIIGFGSIAKRHYDILSSFDNIKKISVVSKQDLECETFKDLSSIENIEQFDYFIVANETSFHYDTLCSILEQVKNKKILVEKPLFEKMYLIESLQNNDVYVAYNMRFHLIIQEIRKIINSEKITYANVKVGQYLPDWRPAVDYRTNYSASLEKGGGVLRDLSHELDYISWLFGKLSFKCTINSKISDLEISSDDIFTAIGYANNTIINVTMDYLNKDFIREIIFYSNTKTVNANLVQNTIQISYTDGKVEDHHFGDIDRNKSFMQMHYNILEENGLDVCSYDEGIKILKLIDGVKYNG